MRAHGESAECSERLLPKNSQRDHLFMKPTMFILLSFGLVLAAPKTPCEAGESWARFRGEGGNGTALDADIPIHFSMEDNVQWKTTLPGKGWSSPVVRDGRIWLTTAIAVAASEEEQARRLAGDPLANMKEVAASVELRAICIDFESGEVLVNVPLAGTKTPEPIHPLNTFASPTSTIDGGKVYCHFGAYGTWCLDAGTGNTVWHAQLKVDHSVGPGSSPVVAGDNLILVCDGIDQQFVVALNKTTGEQVWKTSRPPMRASEVEYRKAYSTPILVEVNGRTQVVVPGAQWICGYDAESGKEIWRIDHGEGFSTSPSAVVTESGNVVFSTGYMRPDLVAVRTDGSGDVTKTHIAWRASRGAPTKPSPVAVGEHIYVVSDSGILTKLRDLDGSIVWQERLSGNFSASPVNVGGKLLFSSHEGVVTVVEASGEYKELAKNELEPRLMASPAVVGDSLIIRTEFSLMRICKAPQK